MGRRDDVLDANEEFYRAFARADVEAMEDIWATESYHVTVVHPGAAAISGRQGVIETWKAIFRDSSHVDIACANAQAFLHGDMAIVICMEVVHGHGLAATNVFCRTDDGWRMIHHHAGPCHTPQRRNPEPRPVLH